MLAWYAGMPAHRQSKLSAGFRRRLTEIQIRQNAGSGAAATSDIAEFDRTYNPGAEQEKTALADLKRQFAFYLFKQRRASERGDKASATEATAQIKQLGDVIHDMELRSLKMGRDLQDLVPKTLLADTARFMAYHLFRAADSVIDEVIAALTRGDPAGARLGPEEIRSALEPILLNAYVLRPIERAALADNPAAPPQWLVASLRSGAAEVLEASANASSLAAP